MVTIRDIARKTKVTPGTVSQVLNGRGRISEETRRRVAAAIESMGYRHQSAGRPRRTAKVSKTIGVIYAQRVAMAGVLSQLSQSWIAGIREAVIESQGHLNLIAGLKDGSYDEMFRQSLKAGDLDGVILIGITADDGQAYLTQAIHAGIPTVVMNRIPLHGEFSYVSMDNFGSGRQGVDHLVSLGHRKIALLHLRVADRFAADRQAGAEMALAAHELEPACVEFVDEKLTDVQLKSAATSIARSGATAVYATAGDPPAVRCVDIWTKMGIRVPQDLSIIGWDDIGPRSAGGLLPTSIGYDKQLMGREATHMLLELMKPGCTARSKGLVIGTRIVERDTTCRLKQGSGR